MTSPMCGSDVVLNTCAVTTRRVDGVDLDDLVALGALECVDLFHLVPTAPSWTISVSSAEMPYVFSDDTTKSEEIAALHRFLHAVDGLIAPISTPSRWRSSRTSSVAEIASISSW